MNNSFLLFYSPKPRSQVRILTHRKWSICLSPLLQPQSALQTSLFAVRHSVTDDVTPQGRKGSLIGCYLGAKTQEPRVNQSQTPLGFLLSYVINMKCYATRARTNGSYSREPPCLFSHYNANWARDFQGGEAR